MLRNIKIPKFIVCFFLFDLALASLYVINAKLGYPHQFLTSLVDLAGEANLPSWYSSIQLFIVSALLAVAPYKMYHKKDMKFWVLLIMSVAFALMSLDEIAQIHEWLGGMSDLLLPGGTRKNTVFHITGIWMLLIGIPFSIFMLGLVFCLKRYTKIKRPIFNKFIIGLIIFMGSANGTEILSNFIYSSGKAKIIRICFEEFGEMVGVTILMWAAYEFVLSHNFSLDTSREN